MSSANRFVGLAVMLSTLAGTAAPLLAQDRAAPDRAAARHAAPLDFRSSKWMSDRKVVNTNDETIASVADFILDRGSGRIDYAILKTDTILGMGGKRVAIAYNALRWDEAGERFSLPLTPEQLKEFPEYSEDEWKSVSDDSSDARALRKRLLSDAAGAARDPYAASIAEAKEVRVKGEIVTVQRVDRSDYGEHVVATVRTEDGERRVALGPSWYVNSGSFAPMRGDQVVIDAVALPRDSEKLLVARSVKVGERDIKLRNDDGAPAWVARTEGDAGNAMRASRRYLLLSSLLGSRVDCRGSECGKVHDVIMERRSGGLAFISVDPNENFLGIADTKRLVAWGVTSVGSDGIVRVDASKEMVLASPETPSDPASLNSGGAAEMVYKAFEIDAPRFEPLKIKAAKPDRDDAWGRSGAICRAIKKDRARTVVGESKGIDDVSFSGSQIPGAHAITVKEGDQEVLVLLGPSWYVKNQKIECNDGDKISIETYRTTINGKDYLLARSVECGDRKIVFIDDDGSPAWDRE